MKFQEMEQELQCFYNTHQYQGLNQPYAQRFRFHLQVRTGIKHHITLLQVGQKGLSRWSVRDFAVCYITYTIVSCDPIKLTNRFSESAGKTEQIL